MKSVSKTPWIILIICIAAIVLTWFFFTEKYEVQVWTGEGKAARLNPYLAAERYLENSGTVVTSDNDQLDFSVISTDDLVFLSKVDNMLVSETQVDAALDWVARGGYLLVGVSHEVEGHASILKEFDIEPEYQDIDIAETFLNKDGKPMSASERMQEVNRKIEEREQAKKHRELSGLNDDEGSKTTDELVTINQDDTLNEQIFDLLNVDFDHEFYRMPISDDDDDLYLAVLDRIVLLHSMTYTDVDDGDRANKPYELTAWVDDEHGEKLLQFEYGKGTFTALSSTDMWTNKYIGLGDHAYFLSYLLPSDSNVHLFYDITAPSVAQLLNKYFYEAVWAGFILLGLWLWSVGFRVQKINLVVEGQRRSFAEHLSSSAKFLLAKKQFQVLLDPIKDDIEKQMRPLCSNFLQLNEHSQIGMLAERTGLPESTLQQWIRYCQKIENQQQLIAALKIGNAIRKKL